MKFPFEVDFSEIEATPEPFVSAVVSSLVSDFLTLPKGEGFIDYPLFEAGYEALKKATSGFSSLSCSVVLKTVLDTPIALVVLRSMLGFTPPEWAYLAAQRYGSELNQGFARTLDRKIRMKPLEPLRAKPEVLKRIAALIETACNLLTQGCPVVTDSQIHRLHKADTVGGLAALRNMAAMGSPYAMLLYERFLGRPFAGHRDSVSEMIGDGLENAIEETLLKAGVKTGERKFEVVACIAGRGFGVRREDMKKLLLATRGKVFTPKTLSRLVECSGLNAYRTKS